MIGMGNNARRKSVNMFITANVRCAILAFRLMMNTPLLLIASPLNT